MKEKPECSNALMQSGPDISGSLLINDNKGVKIFRRNRYVIFFQSCRGSDNPYFLYLAFNAPHDPRQSPGEFVDVYPVEKISVPENLKPRYPWSVWIGRILDVLDRSGLAENTYIFFTSDHGLAIGELGIPCDPDGY